MSYLPLAHIAERMFTIYLAGAQRLARLLLPQRPPSWSATLGAVQPTAFFGVPRVWEKIQAGIQALLAAEQDPARRAAVDAAMATGRGTSQSCEFGNTTPDELAAEFRRADEAVLRPIRSLLGLGEATMVVQRGGAAAARRGRVLRRAGHEDPRRVRDDRDHRRVHRQHAGRVPAGYRGTAGARARR